VRQSADGYYVDVEGVRSFYLQVGQGTPVVLIHGAAPGACATLSWHLNIDPLAASGLTVYAYDQPGFGYSSDPDDDSVEFRVRHARRFLDAIGIERCALVGNSVGAYVAVRLALVDDRVERLVLTASSLLAPPGSAQADALARSHGAELRAFEPSYEAVRKMSLQTVFHSELVTHEFLETRLEMSSGKHLLARATPAEPLGDSLHKVQQPTLILWGTDDRGAAVERALPMLRQIPKAELHIFRECGHWVQWDHADRFNRLVADFLRLWSARDPGPTRLADRRRRSSSRRPPA
jgi:pimeloyl-ACP methyl ester carboxylesterase